MYGVYCKSPRKVNKVYKTTGKVKTGKNDEGVAAIDFNHKFQKRTWDNNIQDKTV